MWLTERLTQGNSGRGSRVPVAPLKEDSDVTDFDSPVQLTMHLRACQQACSMDGIGRWPVHRRSPTGVADSIAHSVYWALLNYDHMADRLVVEDDLSCSAALRDGTVFRTRVPEVSLEDGVLHSATGPAVRWPDGYSLHYLRGVLVPERLHRAMREGRLRVSTVLGLRNQSVMSVLMEQIGWGSVVTDPNCDARVLDHDERWGTLWRVQWAPKNRFAQATLVEVVNRSPEPDGSFRHYWLMVDPQLRPLNPRSYRIDTSRRAVRQGDVLVLPLVQAPPQGEGESRPTVGEPQAMTARNAVASTFGLTGDDYETVLGDES